MRAGTHRETGPSISDANHAVLHADEGWDQNDILDVHSQINKRSLGPLETILIQKALFCMQKPQMSAGTHRDQYFWC